MLRGFPAVLALALMSCAPPPLPPTVTVPAPPDACADAAQARTAATEDLASGRLFRATRALGALDARCPVGAGVTAVKRAEALIELGAFVEARSALALAGREDAARIERGLPEAERRFHALDPAAVVEAGFAATKAGHEAEARRLFDQALARAEQEGGEPLHIEVRDALVGMPRTIVWTPDDRIVVAHGDLVTVVEASTGREVAQVPAPGVDAISPDGKWLARLREPRELQAVEGLTPGPALEAARGLPAPPSLLSAAFSPDGRLLAAGFSAFEGKRYAAGVLVWEIATGKLAHQLQGRVDGEFALVFSPSGALVAAGDRVGNVEVWDVASEKRVLFAPAWTDRELRILQPDATTEMDRSIDGLAFLPGEEAIGAVWEGELHVTPIPPRRRTAASLPARGLLVTAGVHNRYPLMDLATRKRVDEPWIDIGTQLAPSPDSRRFAVAFNEALLIAEHGAVLRSLIKRLRLHFQSPAALAFSDDGTEILIQSYRPGRAWPTEREIPRLASAVDSKKERERWKAQLGLVPSGSGNDLVREATGEVMASCASPLSAVARSADGRLLAVGCGGQPREETRLYDVRSPGKHLATVRALEDVAVALVTAPDGRFEVLGAAGALEAQLRCRIGARTFPLEVCGERLRAPGLLQAVLRGGER